MQEVRDTELLRQYVRENSEAAFATLVARHVNLVYSTALRETGNPAAAEEITQAVFIILARKAGELSRHPALSGWLYQTVRLAAANFLRTEIRRARREQEAYMQSRQTEPDLWPQIMPLLEAAMGCLGEKDRNAIALRFFEGKSFQEIGTAFGASENAAKKRVAYALEKLRKYFSTRGVTSTTAGIACAISTNSVHAAPAQLAKTITAVAMTKGVTASSSTLTLVKGTLKMMTWTNMKTAIVGGFVVLLAAGATILADTEIQAGHQNSDEAALQANWKGRQFYPIAKLPDHPCSLIIAGNKYEFKDQADANAWNKGTFTLREDTTPRQFIAVISDCRAPQFVGKTVLAIYQVTSNRLIIAWSAPGKTNAPAFFEARGAAHMEFKRP